MLPDVRSSIALRERSQISNDYLDKGEGCVWGIGGMALTEEIGSNLNQKKKQS